MISNDIRKYMYENNIKPAKEKGEQEVNIRAGNVHKEMGLANRLLAVCSAIGAKKFAEKYGLQLMEREGPYNRANTDGTGIRLLRKILNVTESIRRTDSQYNVKRQNRGLYYRCP